MQMRLSDALVCGRQSHHRRCSNDHLTGCHVRVSHTLHVIAWEPVGLSKHQSYTSGWTEWPLLQRSLAIFPLQISLESQEDSKTQGKMRNQAHFGNCCRAGEHTSTNRNTGKQQNLPAQVMFAITWHNTQTSFLSKLQAPELKQISQSVTGQKKADMLLSRVSWNKGLTSSAAALQSGNHLPCSKTLNTPSLELQRYLWRVSLSWKCMQLRLAATHPTLPKQTFALYWSSTEHRWIWFGSQWQPGKKSPPITRGKPEPWSWWNWGECTSWSTIHVTKKMWAWKTRSHVQGFWSRLFWPNPRLSW